MRLFLILVFGALAFNDVHGGDLSGWNQYMGPNQTGALAGGLEVNEQTTLQVRWRRTLGSGYSSMVCDNKRLFTMYSDGEKDYLEALMAADGKTIWRYELGATYKGHGGSADGPLGTPLVDSDRVFGTGPFGALFALDKNNGKLLWRVELAALYEAKMPPWGFTSSPIMADGRLIVQMGGPEKSLGAFDPSTGELVWHSGDEPITYQTASVLNLAGKTWLIANTSTHVKGLDPRTGKALWSQLINEQGGSAISRIAALSSNRFLTGTQGYYGAFVAYELTREDDVWKTTEVWKGNTFKGSYQFPVYHKGYLYGLSGAILACINAETGERVWKTRAPGTITRFMMIDDILVSWLKDGELSMGKVGPDGYRQINREKVLDTGGFNQPIFDHNRFYVRNLWEIAAVDPVSEKVEVATPAVPQSSTRFAAFLKELETASDKAAALDAFFEASPQMPLVEGDQVHFLYRGPAKDVAIAGSMSPAGDPLTAAPGTDLFYRTYTVDRRARWEYQFIVDFDQAAADPRNPFKAPGNGRSELRMPEWREPDWLEARQEKPELDEWVLESQATKQKRTISVHLPKGYHTSEQTYPLLVVNHGDAAREHGLMTRALETLMPSEVAPAVVVFAPFFKGRFGIYAESAGDKRKAYVEMLATELLPLLEQKYRLKNSRDARFLMGSGPGAHVSLLAAFTYPDLFGGAAAQSVDLNRHLRFDLLEAMPSKPLRIVLDRCSYEQGSPITDYYYHKEHAALVTALNKKGQQPVVFETIAGSGWGSWRSRTGDLLNILLPVSQ